MIGVLGCLALTTGCDVFVSPQQRIERAAGLIAKGDYNTAAIELRNALKKEPDDARGRLLLARTEFWAGDVVAADRDLRHAMEAGAAPADTARLNAEVKKSLGQYEELAALAAKPQSGLKDYERQMFLGYAQLGLHRTDAARASFDASVKAAGAGQAWAEARTAEAAGLAASGDVQGALATLEAVIARQPDYRPAALAKGNLLLQRGDYVDAEKVLATLAARDDQFKLSLAERVNVLGSLSEARLGQRKLVEAQQSVNQLAALVPDSPVAAYMQGRLALAQGQGAVAVAALQKAVRGAPQFLPARVMLGLAYLDQGKAAQAEAEFQRALDAAPDNLEIRKLLAQAQMRQGRADAAAEVLAPALATDVQDPGVYALAGRARLMRGDEQEGDALLERGLAGTPDDPKLRIEMAGTYLAAGNPQRALEVLASVPDDVGGDAKRQIQFLALAAGKDDAVAKREVETLIERNPRDVKLLNLAAAWLASRGDVAAARAYLQQALAVAPTDARTLANMGGLEVRAGREQDARKAFEAARAADPRNAEAYLGLAGIAERSGDMAGAVRWIAEWSKADPKAPQPRLLLARAAFHDRNASQGRKLVDEALALSPGSASVEGAVGQVLMEAGVYDEALGHFRKASELDELDPRYLLGAARVQIAQERRDAARESLLHALAIRPNWIPAAVLLAQLELTERRVDAALALADGIKKDSRSAPAGYLLEGDILFALRQGAPAAKAYAESTRLQPSAAAAIGESRARRMAGLPQAAAPLVAWLHQSPNDARVRLELAQAYQATGDIDDAVREYEEVLRAQPDAVLALNNLAWLYGDRGDPRAETLARRAQAKAPQSGPVADTLGWILLKSGKTDESLKILQQAHDLDKKNPEIAYHYGAALLKAGMKDQARQVLQGAIEAGNNAPWVAPAQQLLVEAG
ncbi:MAG: XrtA/PEP-CTERM system TPR-repeat protein PrsT [Steroidobacteraceae bacterium]